MTFRIPNEADTIFDCAVSADARHVAYSLTMGKSMFADEDDMKKI